MSLGLIGKKLGMTRIFSSNGKSIPITLIYIPNNYIIQIKNIIDNKYMSFQLSCILKKKKRSNKAILGHYLKSKIHVCKILKEFKINNFDLNKFNLGEILPLNIFYINQKVDVMGISIGKGFSGVIKRYNFKSGRATHGNSRSHNKAGSIGMNQDPGKVFLGKKMAGHLGCNRNTIQNLKIIRIDFIYNVIFIKGAVPGCKNNNVFITPAIKNKI